MVSGTSFRMWAASASRLVIVLGLSAVVSTAWAETMPGTAPSRMRPEPGLRAAADTVDATADAFSQGPPNMIPVGAGALRAHQSQTHQAPIDVRGICWFMLYYAAGTMDLVVTSPSGKTWSESAQAPGGGWVRGGGFMGMGGEGASDVVTIENAEPGTWKVTVTARAAPDTMPEVPYAVMLVQQTGRQGPELRMIENGRADHHLGDSVEVRASLLEKGKAVEGAKVEAGISRPEGEPLRLVLRDDGRPPDSLAGDGIYSGRTPPLRAPGYYSVGLLASRSGIPGKPDFQRTAGGGVAVSRSRSRFNGRYRDFLRDADGDGLSDELVVEVGVTVTDRATIGLRAMLFDAAGHLHDGGSPEITLDPGERTISVGYPLRDLYETGLSGSFLLDTLRLFEEESGWIAGLEERTGAYRTKVYPHEALLYEKIHLNGDVEAHGVDTNGNGALDVLVVEVGVDIAIPGPYLWNGALERGGGGSAGYVQGDERGVLKKGTNRLRFEFPGACVSTLGEAGGYVLGGFYISFNAAAPQPPGAPKYALSGGTIAIPDAPPPSRFETSGPTPYRSPRGGFYSCVASR